MEKNTKSNTLPGESAEELQTCFVLDGNETMPFSGFWVLSDDPLHTEKPLKP